MSSRSGIPAANASDVSPGAEAAANPAKIPHADLRLIFEPVETDLSAALWSVKPILLRRLASGPTFRDGE